MLQEPPVLPGLLYQQLQQPAASSRIAASLVVLHWLQLVATRCRGAATAAAPRSDSPDAEAVVTPSSLTTLALSAAICGEVPEALPDTCLAYLAAPACMPSAPAADPYSEVAPLYARMRKDLYALVNASLQVGVIRCVGDRVWVCTTALAAVFPPDLTLVIVRTNTLLGDMLVASYYSAHCTVCELLSIAMSVSEVPA